MNKSRGSRAGCSSRVRPARRRKAASSSSAMVASGGRSGARPPSSTPFTASTSATAAGALPLAPSAAACSQHQSTEVVWCPSESMQAGAAAGWVVYCLTG